MSGRGELVRALTRRRLVDEYVVLIHPIILGSGRRLLAEGLPPSTLRLIDSRPTANGVVIATYRPADATA
jgi:dihydrofolate reductase